MLIPARQLYSEGLWKMEKRKFNYLASSKGHNKISKTCKKHLNGMKKTKMYGCY